MEGLKSHHGIRDFLDETMILFDHIVQIFDLTDFYNSMFKFLNFGHADVWKIIQQLGTVAKVSVPVGLNLSPPYAYQKALTEKHRPQVPLIL